MKTPIIFMLILLSMTSLFHPSIASTTDGVTDKKEEQKEDPISDVSKVSNIESAAPGTNPNVIGSIDDLSPSSESLSPSPSSSASADKDQNSDKNDVQKSEIQNQIIVGNVVRNVPKNVKIFVKNGSIINKSVGTMSSSIASTNEGIKVWIDGQKFESNDVNGPYVITMDADGTLIRRNWTPADEAEVQRALQENEAFRRQMQQNMQNMQINIQRQMQNLMNNLNANLNNMFGNMNFGRRRDARRSVFFPPSFGNIFGR